MQANRGPNFCVLHQPKRCIQLPSGAEWDAAGGSDCSLSSSPVLYVCKAMYCTVGHTQAFAESLMLSPPPRGGMSGSAGNGLKQVRQEIM